MKNLYTRTNPLFIILAIALLPFASISQDSAEPIVTVVDPESETSDPEAAPEETQVQVSDIKKMTRYSLGFVIDLPSMDDVLTFMNTSLGVDIQEADHTNDPNWDASSLVTRNFQVTETENGEYEVKVRFYPPVDPMSVENVGGIQKESRIKCAAAIEKLKAKQIN